MRKKRLRFERLCIVIIVFIIGCLICLLGIVKTVEHFKEPIVEFDLTKFKYRNGFMYFDDDRYESITGIDVCSFQKHIDWNRVKKDGIQFVFVRCGFRDATDGTLYLDPKFDEYVNGATQAGLEVGIYFYSSAISYDEVIEEAQYVESLIAPYSISYPIAYDMEFYEGGRLNELSQEEKTLFARTFCDYFNERGYDTLVYGNLDWLTNQLNFNEIAGNYKVWYAAYLSSPQLEYPFTIWQYTSSGVVDGIEGNVDMNIYIKKIEKVKDNA